MVVLESVLIGIPDLLIKISQETERTLYNKETSVEYNNRTNSKFRYAITSGREPFAAIYLETPVIPINEKEQEMAGGDSMFFTWCKVFGIWSPDDW